MGQAGIAKCSEVLSHSDHPQQIDSRGDRSEVQNHTEPTGERKKNPRKSKETAEQAAQNIARSKQEAANPSAKASVPAVDNEKVEQLRKELQIREETIEALRKDAAQRSRLVQALENEAFEKAEAISELQQKQSVEEEARKKAGVKDLAAVRQQLEEKEELILRLQQRVAGDEETLKSVIAEARAKGDAVEGLVCSLTRQMQMGEDARNKIQHLEDQRRDHDVAIAQLKAEASTPSAGEAVVKLKRQLNEKELKIRALQAEVANERAMLMSSSSASTSAMSVPSPAKAEEHAEVHLKQTRRLSKDVVAGAVSTAIMQVAINNAQSTETNIYEEITVESTVEEITYNDNNVQLTETTTVESTVEEITVEEITYNSKSEVNALASPRYGQKSDTYEEKYYSK